VIRWVNRALRDEENLRQVGDEMRLEKNEEKEEEKEKKATKEKQRDRGRETEREIERQKRETGPTGTQTRPSTSEAMR